MCLTAACESEPPDAPSAPRPTAAPRASSRTSTSGESAPRDAGRPEVWADPLGAPLLAAPSRDSHINDHAFVRAPDRSWRFFAIVGPNPPRPKLGPGEAHPLGRSFGHAASAKLTSGWAYREDRPFYEKVGANGVLWAPRVIWDGSRYHMFYCTGGEASAFAIAWSDPVVLFRDGWQARDPMVLRVEERKQWVLYYTATEDPAGRSRHVVAFRTSTDLERWSERRIAYRDAHVGTGYGPTESPFVVHRGGFYYLFIGPRPYDAPRPGHPNWAHPGYVGSDVFKSRRFDRWTDADLVGHLAVHAAEVVEDDDGRWYVSSAGIRQGGLFLSELHWSDRGEGAERRGR
jgi:beta-fructofuranosidase